MYKLVKLVRPARFLHDIRRTFLSQAYHCEEIWQNRLTSSIIQKVNLDMLYYELDQRFQKTRQMSPVDVDIFVNAISDEHFIDEAMDLVHKLRLTAETGATLASTPHALIKLLLKNNKTDELLRCLDDRLNYGLFLDDHTANILLDTFHKSGNFTAGAIVASQIMLQEDFRHPITKTLAILTCYKYLKQPGQWPERIQPEEPEEEVKIRVSYLRNPYHDQHFDLTDPARIVGKTLAAAATANDPLDTSLRIVGLALLGDESRLQNELDASKNVELIREVVELAPETAKGVKSVALGGDPAEALEKRVRESVAGASERDVANQCEIYEKWGQDRLRALEAQRKRIEVADRLAEIERLQASLKEREQRLWFFENEEQVELQISEKEADAPQKAAQAKQADEEYVPPEIRSFKN